MSLSKKRYKCECCEKITAEDELLRATSPFDQDQTLLACPYCLSIDGDANFRLICDEPDCEQIATCGFPTDDNGYRRTCFEHSKNNNT